MKRQRHDTIICSRNPSEPSWSIFCGFPCTERTRSCFVANPGCYKSLGVAKKSWKKYLMYLCFNHCKHEDQVASCGVESSQYEIYLTHPCQSTIPIYNGTQARTMRPNIPKLAQMWHSAPEHTNMTISTSSTSSTSYHLPSSVQLTNPHPNAQNPKARQWHCVCHTLILLDPSQHSYYS